MKRIMVEELHIGDVLARPVISDRGNVLLYEGAPISEENIEKLKTNHIEEVCVLEEDSEIGAFTVEAIHQDALKTVENLITKRIYIDGDVDSAKMQEVVSNLITDIVNNPKVNSHLMNIKRFRNDLYSHSMSTAAMSVIMGLKLQFSMTQLHDIALGAMLHDVGLREVGMDYMNVEVSRLPADEKFLYRKHVINGYEKLRDEPWMTETTKMIILSHHERMDGSGYPFHKLGVRIPQEVRLVSICDYFDELANGIGYEARKVHEVVEILRVAGTTLFDYDMMMKVITNIAWYPSGALVRTNENELARVIRQNAGLPDRPVLQIVLDKDGVPPKQETIKDLVEYLTIFIEETLEE